MKKLIELKTRPSLNNYKELKEKFDAVCKYLTIDTIICVVPDLSLLEKPKDFKYPPDLKTKFKVTDTIGPRSSYVKSTINDWTKKLAASLDEYMESEESFDEKTKCLSYLKRECNRLAQMNDMYKDMQFDETFRWVVTVGRNQYSIPYFHMLLSQMVADEIIRHFHLRKQFFWELYQACDTRLSAHVESMNKREVTFKWHSKHALYEIAEFLESLRLTHRIKEDKNTSFAKLYKEFYNLFGLSSDVRHSKLQQLRKRSKDHPSYLRQLATAIEEDIVKIQKENDQ